VIQVIGSWELGWNAPIKEYDLWKHMLDDFSIDKWIMSPITGISKNVIEVPDISEYLDQQNWADVIFIDENGTIELEEFQHPENVIYVFGRTGFSAWEAFGRKGKAVKIQTPAGAIGGLWAHQAAAIVLYDRWMKV